MASDRFRLEALEPRLLLSSGGLVDEALALADQPLEHYQAVEEYPAEGQVSIAEQTKFSYQPEAQLQDLLGKEGTESETEIPFPEPADAGQEASPEPPIQPLYAAPFPGPEPADAGQDDGFPEKPLPQPLYAAPFPGNDASA